MTAYYNENDERMADVLEELIRHGHIAPGVVDRRSIVDVRADELRPFTQCHFFAGIGVWSHALRRAGWPDDRPCWTGSCPCQPFSLAGKGAGFDDPRHLWPYWFRLIAEHRPGRCFGEQVASAGQWLDLVAADMEGIGFAFAAVDLAAAGFAGAHIRQRFFWVADAYDAEWWADHAPRHVGDWPPAGRLEGYGDAGQCGSAGWVADSTAARLSDAEDAGATSGNSGALCASARLLEPEREGVAGGLGHADQGRSGRDDRALPSAEGSAGRGLWGLGDGVEHAGPDGWVGNNNNNNNNTGLALRPGPIDERGAIRLEGPALSAPGPLFGCDWLVCHDARIRPVEPGTFPLVVEAPARLGRLHGYGNAIDAETASQFISAYIAAAENQP